MAYQKHPYGSPVARRPVIAIVTALGIAIAACSAASTMASAASPSPAADGDQPLSADVCTRALPGLQDAADGEQSGHIQAARTLEACYRLRGQSERASQVQWQIDFDLDRGDPHDE
ncbi:MAG TPA: hypothetical protein VM659_27860 [Dongiaceae bacterium]|nr:hypothetical protein [Dongiaceae bacterium]